MAVLTIKGIRGSKESLAMLVDVVFAIDPAKGIENKQVAICKWFIISLFLFRRKREFLMELKDEQEEFPKMMCPSSSIVPSEDATYTSVK